MIEALRTVQNFVVAPHGHELSRDPSHEMEPRLRLWLEADRGGWPREFLDVRVRGEIYFAWFVSPIYGRRELLNTYVVQRQFQFVAWLNEQLRKEGPWPRTTSTQS